MNAGPTMAAIKKIGLLYNEKNFTVFRNQNVSNLQYLAHAI